MGYGGGWVQLIRVIGDGLIGMFEGLMEKIHRIKSKRGTDNDCCSLKIFSKGSQTT